jgi:autophagy-related protein 9
MMFSGQNFNALSIFKWKWRGESSLSNRLLDDVPPEIELSDYRRVPSPGCESPSGLLNGDRLNVETVAVLDLFFERLYNYYCEKGLWCIIIKWIVELFSMGFTIGFSGFFYYMLTGMVFVMLSVGWMQLNLESSLVILLKKLSICTH